MAGASLLRATTKKLFNNTGTAIGVGLSGYFGYDAYQTSRQEGNGVVSSMASAGVEAALPFLMGGWAYAGYLAVSELPGALTSAAEGINQYGRELSRQSRNKPFNNTRFADTEQISTMRQAGMALAQKSKYNLQQTMLGNEAQYMHR